MGSFEDKIKEGSLFKDIDCDQDDYFCKGCIENLAKKKCEKKEKKKYKLWRCIDCIVTNILAVGLIVFAVLRLALENKILEEKKVKETISTVDMM